MHGIQDINDFQTQIFIKNVSLPLKFKYNIYTMLHVLPNEHVCIEF